METLEIFLWIIIAVNFFNLFYVIGKTPFWDYDKQFLWRQWILFCFLLLVVFTIICYFHNNLDNHWIHLAIILGLGADLCSYSFVKGEFKAVMEHEFHSFKIERIENGRIFGELIVAGRDDTFPAEMINAPRGKYKIGDNVSAKVVICTIEKIKVEPQTT